MSGPGGRPLQEQLNEVHQDMLAACRLSAKDDAEVGHIHADNHLTRLVVLLTDGRSAAVQRAAHLALRAYNRTTRYCA